MMEPTRRDALRLGAAAGVAILAGCAEPIRRLTARELPDRIELPSGPQDPNLRLANRLGFGPAPGDLSRIDRIGREAFVREQLAAGSPEDPYLTVMLHRLDALRIDSAELQDLPEQTVLRQLQQAGLLRAVFGRNQLRERMTDFWTNHFNVYARKAEGAYRKPADEEAVIRKHALGKFPDLLRASAKSPAMLVYLDNQENRAGVPNENYARELLELHTLGVDGGYEYQDIKELARCLTGWTVEDRFLRPYGKWRFDPELHDDGAKTVLGTRIPAGQGEKDVEIVLDLLSRHPSTARFLARKVCRYFLGDAGESREKGAAKAFADSGGDVRATLGPILSSKELLEGPPILKRPFDFVASSLRAFGVETDCGSALLDHLERMGQPLYEWPMPDGYPDKTAAWTGSLMARWNFALALAFGEIPGASIPLEGLRDHTNGDGPGALAGLAMGKPGKAVPGLLEARQKAWSGPSGRGSESNEEWAQSAALCLCAPDFQWR